MRTEIFIVSFSRDAEFLRYCLKSIAKFATGFAGVCVVVPNRDAAGMSWVKTDYGARLGGFDEAPEKGMMHHEYHKIIADRWCPFADAILHLDSDCMFWEPVSPDDYFHDGKCILYCERYATVVNKIRLNWREAVKKATGIDPVYEFMVRHPIMHVADTYRKTRELIVTQTGMGVEQYVLSCKNDFPQSFAEFPTLGAVAHEYIRDRYHFVDFDTTTEDGGYPYERGRDKLMAFWSHGGIERYRAEAEKILS